MQIKVLPVTQTIEHETKKLPGLRPKTAKSRKDSVYAN
jgi:hypothetical protein